MIRETAQRVKRAAMNWRDACLPVRDYAQHGEESILRTILPSGFRSDGGTFIDVGANQPTRLSNTYWLYRQGFSGIAVEPDPDLSRLWRSIRPRDLFVCAGCGPSAGVSSFRVARASVNSAIQLPESDVVRTISVPIVTVDQVASLKPGVPVVVLSVDVEGFECEVLQGARATLARTAIVLIEENGREAEITSMLSRQGHRLASRVGCNLVFRNDAVLGLMAPV